jgi:flavin-dependent thymidylate synthase
MSDQEDPPDWAVAYVLDHGFVALVDAMPHWDASVSETGLRPCDARIVDAARVSHGRLDLRPSDRIALETQKLLNERAPAAMGKQPARTKDKDENLIRYLYAHEHFSPFEKVRFEFSVKLPIFVARQWVRHRMGSFNEVSARYSELPAEFYIPALDRMQAQASKNKQASGAQLPDGIALELQSAIELNSAVAYNLYKGLLEKGLARELARMVLPTNVYTSWYWTVDLRNLFHFIHLRADEHAQYEIRVYAEAMLKMLRIVAPVATAAFEQAEKETRDAGRDA